MQMSRGALVAIVAGIIITAAIAGIAAITTGDKQAPGPEGGKQLTLDLNENLTLKESR